ncbi:hypothetical protein [Kaistella montana]|uniref:Uncharacterized protein n=1 Tax=Kaistella montana TaxID=1849733 RepID=A0ABW5KCW3_9FLAO|nr:hypothetical protein [Kaistella montana]MCQ4035955.1 hypothetical protein [Kaistella montana]
MDHPWVHFPLYIHADFVATGFRSFGISNAEISRFYQQFPELDYHQCGFLPHFIGFGFPVFTGGSQKH